MTLEEQLVNLLISKNYQISFAESCTGGLACAAIVNVANASQVLGASVVTYANEAKTKYALVNPDTISLYGAVSENTAGEMAAGIAKSNNANVGVGISGIAGPTGGTQQKPVGTVCFGFCINGKLTTSTVHFGNLGRQQIRHQAVTYALETLIKLL